MPRKKKQTEQEYTAEEITNMVMTKLGTTPFSTLQQQMEDDFNLLALDPYVPAAEHQAYTSPKPRNHFYKVNQGLNKASLTWRIALTEDAPQVDRDAAGKGEDFLTAVYSQADRNARNRGEPPNRESQAWFACSRGMIAQRCVVYLDDSDEMVFDIRALDPLHQIWENGHEGLAWEANIYVVSKAEAKDRWGLTLTSDEATVIDWFNRKYNAVVLHEGAMKEGDSHWVKKLTPHGLDHVPVFIGFAGGMPNVFNKQNLSLLQHRAASVYASSRGIYMPFNKQVSFIMDNQERAVVGSQVFESEDGMQTLKDNPFVTYTTIRLKYGKEKLYPLETPKVPPETGMLMGIIDRDMQESSVPYPVGYGIDPSSHSGAALSVLSENMKTLYDPYTSLIAQAYRWTCEEIFSQFKLKGKQVKLSALKEGTKFFSVEAKPEDIKDDWYIDVTMEPKLPRDEAGELQMALQATSPRPPDGRPFISDYTAREKIMKLPKPDAEETRIDDQVLNRKIDSLPQVQLRKIAKAMVEKGDRQGAQDLLASIPAPRPAGPGQPQGAPGGPGSPGQAGMTGGPMMAPGGNGQGPTLTPQEAQELQAIVEQMQAAGRPIPPEVQAVLAQTQGGP